MTCIMTPGTNSGSREREGGDAGGECSSVDEGGLFVGGVRIGWSLSESIMSESSKPEGLCTDVHDDAGGSLWCCGLGNCQRATSG